MSNSVPTVNVLMTYNPLKMIEFQQAGSLAVFKDSADLVDSFIFSNAPGSNFISLSHEFGMVEGNDNNPNSAQLVLEFVDPRGLFDSNVDFTPTAMMSIKNDLLYQRLEEERREYIGLFNKMYSTQAGPLFPILPKAGFAELVSKAVDKGWVDEARGELIGKIKELETLNQANDYNPDDPLGETAALKAANKQIWAHKNQLVRPVYITYGIGDNLADWCPPMVFNKAMGIEFSFNAQGGRIMKVVYDGVGSHPTLTPMGIMPLGTLGMGAVINGTSRRLFNGEAQVALQNEYPFATGAMSKKNEVDAKRVVKPSLHKIITDTFKDFLEKSINAYKPGRVSNVVLLFPDLDPLLSMYYKAEYESVKSSNADGTFLSANKEEQIVGDQIWNIEATCEALEGLGFTISIAKNGFKGRVGDSIYNEIESQVDDISNFNWLSQRPESNPGPLGLFLGADTYRSGTISPESVVGWLGERDIRCEMQTDGLNKSVANTIADIAASINKKVMEFTTHSDHTVGLGAETEATTIDWIQYIETDFNVLQVLHKHGLIADPTQPALVAGDRDTIKLILDGEMVEKAYAAMKRSPTFSEDEWNNDVWEAVAWGMGWLSRFDVEDGWTSDVVRDLYDVGEPIPWLGPFGPTGNMDDSMENFLPDDVNLQDSSWATLKEEQPDTVRRVPVFSFGTKNPNILEFDYDFKGQYYELINSFDYIQMSSFQRTTAILGASTYAAQEACNLLSQINEFQDVDFKGPKKDGIPIGFAAIMEPLWNKLQSGSGGSAIGSENWEKVFISLGAAVPEVADIGDKEFKNFSHYVEFMWRLFTALTSADYQRFQVKNTGINNVGGALTRWANSVNDLAKMAIRATIKTTPMFHLGNHRRVVQRQSLVLGIEPRFSGIDKSVIVPAATWFSGVYELFGFKHEISSQAVQSNFLLVKGANTGGYLVGN